MFCGSSMLSSKILQRLSWRYILPALGLIVVVTIFLRQRSGFIFSYAIGSLKPPHSPSGPTVELVVASIRSDDVSWLQKYLPQWKANIYVVDDKSAPLTTPLNKGREAMVYLT